MNKGLTPDRSSRTSGKERDRDLGSIASHAIAVMASRVPHPGSWDEAALAHLESAVSDADRGRRIAVVDAMNAAGLEDVDIVDRYIPETARRIGEKWHQDDLSFADVTIRVSRLQAMAREMAVEWERSVESDPAAPAALVVVRRNEHHTLGASVLASQLRRMGVAVRVSLCSPDEDVVAEARDGDYRMVAISSSSYESVYSLRDLVAKLQDVGDGGLKTAVGGSILRRDEDLRHVLGVDVATDDPVEAMVRCGLRSSLSPPPPTKGRTIASAARS